jgi:hypothetical protein
MKTAGYNRAGNHVDGQQSVLLECCLAYKRAFSPPNIARRILTEVDSYANVRESLMAYGMCGLLTQMYFEYSTTVYLYSFKKWNQLLPAFLEPLSCRKWSKEQRVHLRGIRVVCSFVKNWGKNLEPINCRALLEPLSCRSGK